MVKFRTQPSRREFLGTLVGAGAVMMLSPFVSRAWTSEDLDPRVAGIVKNTLGIDAHNHIDIPLVAGEASGIKVDLKGELKRSGLSAICMTFAVDYQTLRNPGDAYERFTTGLTNMDKILAENGMKRSLNLTDLNTAHNKHQPTVIQSVEGGHFLEGKIERLSEAYDRGLRHLGLLHDNDASVPLGDVFTNPPRWGGLTSFGAEVIKECNRLGILVDLSHANTETVLAAMKVTTHPVIISHTGLDTRLGQNEFMSRMMRPRLISKENAKIVADAGGVIGVWTHLAETPMAYAENVRALVDVVGVDHVGIGTDTKLTPSYRSPGDVGQRPQGSEKQFANDSGEKRDAPSADKPPKEKDNQKGERVGERTNQAWRDQKNGFYYAVVDAMLKTGFSAGEIGKIGGGNFCRVFDVATKG